MKTRLLIALLLAAPAWAHAQTDPPSSATPPQWQSSGPAQFVCGGVSDEDMAAIKSQRSSAGSELLFTSGPEGAYIADVAVTVSGGKLKEALSFRADGPLCLLKLPKGGYTVEAEYLGKTIKHAIKVDGPVKQSKFNWPTL